MGSKFFDIPFRSLSTESDFSCKDGEIIGYGSYLSLPPRPEIDFALVRTHLPGWHNNPDVYPSKTLVASEPSMEYRSSLAASLLAQFQADASLQSLFISPFYILGAWKTYTGTYLCASDPVLMIPNSEAPLVATDDDLSSQDLTFKIAAAICRPYFKIKAPEVLRDWVGKIKSLEILVSAPLFSYDTFHAFLPLRNVSTDSYCGSLDIQTGVIADRRICTDTLKMAWKPLTKGIGDFISDTDTFPSSLKYFRLASIPLSEVDLASDWTNPSSLGTVNLNYLFSLSYAEITGETQDKSHTIVIKGEDKGIDVMTRPLKLSGAGEFKHIRRVHLRGNFDPALLTLSVYGSRDMLKWLCISQRKGGALALLPHSSFRFYKIGIKGYLASNHTLEGITIT